MKTLSTIFLLGLLGVVAFAQTELRLDSSGVDPLSTEGIRLHGKFSAYGYENPILGFSIDAPDGFERKDNPATKELLFLYAVKGGSLAAGLEKVQPGTTSEFYAESNIAALKRYPSARLSKQLAERTLGGRIWQAYEVELTTNGVVVKQLYLMRVEVGHAIFLVGSIGDPGIENKIVTSLNSLKFKE